MENLTDNPQVVWISDNAAFVHAAEAWRECEFLAIDTEFERRTTYYPILALVQVFDGEMIYLIDPLEVECPQAFRDVLADDKIVKILHSAKEDLEVFYFSWQCLIKGLFDTQVAHAFAHSVNSIGYAALVSQICDVQLGKEATQSDWLARPLSANQQDYAAKDVLYLAKLYQSLSQDLSSKKSLSLFQSECSELTQGVLKQPDFEQDYRNAKEVCRLTSEQLIVFKRLYQWREKVAVENNRTRNHIAKDGILVKIAMLKPRTKKFLQKLDGLHPKSVRLYGDEIVSIVAESLSTTQESLQQVPNPRDVDGMKLLTDSFLKESSRLAAAEGIDASLLGSKRMLRKVALAYLTGEAFPDLWLGWRGDILKPEFDRIISEFNATKAL